MGGLPLNEKPPAFSLNHRALFDHLAIRKGPGDCLTDAETAAILDFYLALLEGAVLGRSDLRMKSVKITARRLSFCA